MSSRSVDPSNIEMSPIVSGISELAARSSLKGRTSLAHAEGSQHKPRYKWGPETESGYRRGTDIKNPDIYPIRKWLIINGASGRT